MEEEVKNNVENKVRPQNKHLIPLKKGETANPNGRPLGQRNYATIYREALLKLAEINGKTVEELENELIASGFAQAKKDFRFYKDIQDRLHGTATIKSESEVKVTGTINTQDPKALEIAQKYEEELRQKLNEPTITS